METTLDEHPSQSDHDEIVHDGEILSELYGWMGESASHNDRICDVRWRTNGHQLLEAATETQQKDMCHARLVMRN